MAITHKMFYYVKSKKRSKQDFICSKPTPKNLT